VGLRAPKIQLSAQDESSTPYRAILLVGYEPSDPLELVIPFGPTSYAWSLHAL